MAFRDDRDALLARNDALQQQLDDAKRALAEKERELARANTPPASVENAPAETDASERASVPREPAPLPAGNTRARGARLAEDLISDDPEAIARAKAALRTAAPIVSDAAAGVLIEHLRRGGAEAERVCLALAQPDAPGFGGKSWSRLFRAFMKIQRDDRLGPRAKAAMQTVVSRGPDKGYLRRKQDARAATASTNLAVRVLSVATRSWVIVVLGLPALFGTIAIVTTPSARLPIAIGLACLAFAVVWIDAFKRRCPGCRKLLAGKRLSIVADDYGGHILSWSCVFCQRRWKT